MTKTYLRLFGPPLAALSLAVVSCGPNKAATEAAAAIPNSGSSSSAAVYKDVNAYRAKFGKPPIPRHKGLDQLAQSHSEFLARNRGTAKLGKGKSVNHIGFGDRRAAASAKYGITSIHENVAAGTRGSSMVRTWAASAAHEPAMRRNWAYTGVGVATAADGTVFATQLFGSGAR